MMHGDHLSMTLPDSIDQAVRATNEFAEGGVPHFWNNTAGLDELFELVDRYDETRHQDSGISRGVAADILVDGIQVLAGLGRPVNAAHRP
jgi:hypothetical protein